MATFFTSYLLTVRVSSIYKSINSQAKSTVVKSSLPRILIDVTNYVCAPYLHGKNEVDNLGNRLAAAICVPQDISIKVSGVDI